jgi:hypothetical protein
LSLAALHRTVIVPAFGWAKDYHAYAFMDYPFDRDKFGSFDRDRRLLKVYLFKGISYAFFLQVERLAARRVVLV